MAREPLRAPIPRGQRHLRGADFGTADRAGEAAWHELPRGGLFGQRRVEPEKATNMGAW